MIARILLDNQDNDEMTEIRVWHSSIQYPNFCFQTGMIVPAQIWNALRGVLGQSHEMHYSGKRIAFEF
jgi:hypothetical protein